MSEPDHGDGGGEMLSRFWGGVLLAVGALFMATGGLCALGMLYAGLLSINSEITVTTPDGVTTTMPDSGVGLYGLFSSLSMAAIGAMVAWGGLVLFRHALATFRGNASAPDKGA